jgi:hypothetical protein
MPEDLFARTKAIIALAHLGLVPVAPVTARVEELR